MSVTEIIDISAIFIIKTIKAPELQEVKSRQTSDILLFVP